VPNLAHTSPDHDDALIARLAADDLIAGSADDRLARSWVADCPACAELLGDLQSIVAATSALPTPRRTRDFRLTEADAARLRPRGWRGLVARFGSPEMAFTRPLAPGLATLGIAGLLLTSLPLGLPGASSTSERALSPIANPVGGGNYGAAVTAAPAPAIQEPPPSAASSALPAGAAPSPAASSIPAPAASDVRDGSAPDSASPSIAPAPPSGGGGVGLTTDGGSKGAGTGADVGSPAPGGPTPSDTGAPAGQAGPSPLVVLSLLLLASGLVLGGLRLAARRLA